MLAANGASDRIALMGVLNATPDSFSDGGVYASPNAAAERVQQILDQGADIIDIGGESTRPGAESVPAREQIRRVSAALGYSVGQGAVVSIDTTSPEVADFALGQGAQIVNDVSCLADPELADVVARRQATLIIMHSRGPMSQMAGFSEYPEDGYADVVRDVADEWRKARDIAIKRGVDPRRVWFDPGIGFAKNATQSVALLSRLDEFQELQAVTVVGPSRKSFIAALDGAPPAERLGGTIAACLGAAARGAQVLRVHDVLAIRQALDVRRAIDQGTMEDKLRA